MIILTMNLSGCGNNNKSTSEEKIDYLAEIQKEDVTEAEMIEK